MTISLFHSLDILPMQKLKFNLNQYYYLFFLHLTVSSQVLEAIPYISQTGTLKT